MSRLIAPLVNRDTIYLSISPKYIWTNRIKMGICIFLLLIDLLFFVSEWLYQYFIIFNDVPFSPVICLYSACTPQVIPFIRKSSLKEEQHNSFFCSHFTSQTLTLSTPLHTQHPLLFSVLFSPTGMRFSLQAHVSPNKQHGITLKLNTFMWIQWMWISFSVSH